MNLRRKRPLTLFEVVIALSLTAILVSALFGYYRKNATLNLEVRSAKEKLFPRQILDLRLSEIFGNMQLISSVASKEKPRSSLYVTSHAKAEGDVLVFQYDSGIDKDPAFCHEVDAMLLLDRNHRLCLITWPNDEPLAPTLPIEKGRQEVLMHNVQTAQFRFFGAQKKEWQAHWSKEQTALPVMVELTLIEEHSTQGARFVYFLPADPIAMS